jgi:ferredoxin
MGWHGIALTPEYGPRNRFVSIITEAPLKPDPLYNGPKLCDMCGECIRACPTDAYRKEVNGVKTIVIEGREYSFANKNLWRCSWAEHFGLDLDMEIPEKVDEDVIMQYYEKYGMRGGAMGVCIKCCLPAHLRIKDSTYTKYYRRKRHYIPSDLPVHRSLIDKINTIAYNYYIDSVSYINKETLDKKVRKIGNILNYFFKAFIFHSICCAKTKGSCESSYYTKTYTRKRVFSFLS